MKYTKSPDNPFITNGYFGSDYFCDRENELEILLKMQKNDTNYLLISRRKMGKSALIYRFFEEVKSKNDIICIFVDLFATQNIHDFIMQFATSVYDEVKFYKPILTQFLNFLKSLRISISYDSLSGLPEFRLQFSQQQEMQQTLIGILNFLETQNRKVIVAFDEFQQIADYPEKNIEPQLRTLIQKMHNVQFIFSGSDQRILTEMFFIQKRPFYNSTTPIFLNEIEKEIYAQFIENHFIKHKKSITKQSIDFIFDWTKTHTLYVQQVCKNCFELSKKSIVLEDVQIVCKHILSINESIYQQYRILLTKNQWQLLIAIAKEEMLQKPTSTAFLQKYDLGNASSVKLAIKSLLEKKMILCRIENEELQYFIDDLFFMRYLQNRY